MKRMILFALLGTFLAILAFIFFSPSKNTVTVLYNSGVHEVHVSEGVGAEPDLIFKIANSVQKQIKYKTAPFENLLSALNNGAADMGAAGISINEAKLAELKIKYPNIVFIPYAETKTFIIMKPKADTKLPIGVQAGTTNELIAHEKKYSSIKSFSTTEEVLKAFADGQISGYIMDSLTSAPHSQDQVTLIAGKGEHTKNLKYVICVHKKSKDILEKIPHILKELKHPVSFRESEVSSITSNLKVTPKVTPKAEKVEKVENKKK